MTPYPSELPDVSSYVDLIDRFIRREISAPDFEKSFLQAMKSERRTLGFPMYPILQELFEDADAYVEHAELRTKQDLDDDQLLASAVRARRALRGLGYAVRPRQIDDKHLFNPEGPALSLLAATPSDVANLLMAWTPAHPQWDIVRVRGRKSSDEARFFDELAAAMQFPYYFGENWSAVWDCITDLNWLKGSSFLIVFDSAEYLLTESPRGFKLLLDELTDANTLWHRETADFGAGDRRPIAFQSVLACDPNYVDALTRRMRDADTNFEVL